MKAIRRLRRRGKGLLPRRLMSGADPNGHERPQPSFQLFGITLPIPLGGKLVFEYCDDPFLGLDRPIQLVSFQSTAEFLYVE